MRPDSFCVEMLGQSARISSADAVVLDALASVFRDLRCAPVCAATTELVVRSTDGGAAFVMDIDGQQQWTASSVASVVQECVMRLNQIAVAGCQSLALHAGGVQARGVGVVFPAKSGSGKSTLTAGLVRAGHAYLSDEAIALDWGTHVIEPYPKPISLDPGAYSMFTDWSPDFADDNRAETAPQWHVAAGAIRHGAVGQQCEVGYIVFPEYQPDAGTRLEPISKGRALLEMCKNTFRFNQQGRRALDHLGEVVRAANCYRLPMDNLDDAMQLVSALVGGVGT